MKTRTALKFNLIVALVTLALQLLLAFSPFIPLTAQLWQASFPQDFCIAPH